jgi:hypothetical protein
MTLGPEVMTLNGKPVWQIMKKFTKKIKIGAAVLTGGLSIIPSFVKYVLAYRRRRATSRFVKALHASADRDEPVTKTNPDKLILVGPEALVNYVMEKYVTENDKDLRRALQRAQDDEVVVDPSAVAANRLKRTEENSESRSEYRKGKVAGGDESETRKTGATRERTTISVRVGDYVQLREVSQGERLDTEGAHVNPASSWVKGKLPRKRSEQSASAAARLSNECQLELGPIVYEQRTALNRQVVHAWILKRMRAMDMRHVDIARHLPLAVELTFLQRDTHVEANVVANHHVSRKRQFRSEVP